MISVQGIGAVSPAGWGMDAFRAALAKGEPLPITELSRPNRPALRVRAVPPPNPRPQFLGHPRLRRASPISHYCVAAALEALGADAARSTNGELKLGVVFCSLGGSVNYSRRFFEEALRDPASASPMLFPETVYNAPSSHLAALIGATGINYTLVGDAGTYLVGVALAADWLLARRVDGCVVIGAEERDWLIGDALRLLNPAAVHADGAGAMYLRRSEDAAHGVTLKGITSPQSFTQENRREAIGKMVAELRQSSVTASLLCDSRLACAKADAQEDAAWSDWAKARMSVKPILGEALLASAGWQCVAAVDALQQKTHSSALVSTVGLNQQAIGAHFQLL